MQRRAVPHPLARAELAGVSVADACKHPVWSMGAKISIDSATLMNKGLELIEAHHLFPVGLDKLDVIIHPQSVVHSMVEYVDGSVLAQLGTPDMRIPIAYAMAWPERIATPAARLDLAAVGRLEFEAPDLARFPCLALAWEAMRAGGSAIAGGGPTGADSVRARPTPSPDENSAASRAVWTGETPALRWCRTR